MLLFGMHFNEGILDLFVSVRLIPFPVFMNQPIGSYLLLNPLLLLLKLGCVHAPHSVGSLLKLSHVFLFIVRLIKLI